ncbi:MAG: B12-binding domain-containing radical SAM protein [Bacilli bacterium]
MDRTLDLPVALLYVPITDPTSGYHSLSYLAAYARAQGFSGIEVIDANIEALMYAARPDEIARLKEVSQDTIRMLGEKEGLTGIEQSTYLYAWLAQALDAKLVERAIGVLKDKEMFYQYPRYRIAVGTLLHWLQCISVLGIPGAFTASFSLNSRGAINLNMTEDLKNDDLLRRLNGPFENYYASELIPRLKRREYRVIGVNITYSFQLPFALRLLRLVRKSFPDVVVVAGGTEVSDVWKYIESKDKFRVLFEDCDACVIGEGEEAFSSLLGAVAAGEPLLERPNLVLMHETKQPRQGDTVPIWYQALDVLPCPDFDADLQRNLYWSPERFVYFSPSRGCYWNKCTFCDYGLNFGSPTSPWRTTGIDKIMSDLREISKTATFVYFSVDVLAPVTLLKLAERIAEEKMSIYWGAEIRLETYWNRERADMLKRGGCVAVSVGFESGNERILRLIDKGTSPERIAETIAVLTEAGIAVQMMGFTGFPSETAAEALDSIRFLVDHREHWTFGGLGTFVLTPGAIIARKPQEFNIGDIRGFTGEDIHRSLYYRDPIHDWQQELDAEWVQKVESAKSMLEHGGFARPFVGGVDTPHSMMYHRRYGTSVVSILNGVSSDANDELNLRVQANGFALKEEYVYCPPKFYTVEQYLKEFTEKGGSLSSRQLDSLRAQVTVHRSNLDASYWFLSFDGRFSKINAPLYRLLKSLEDESHWRDAMHQWNSELGDGEVQELLRMLLQRKFIAVVHSRSAVLSR